MFGLTKIKNKANWHRALDFKHRIHFRFSAYQLGKCIVMFAVLVFIALFVKDQFVRPIGGDVLVVIWLYYLLSSVIDMPSKQLTFTVLGIAYLVELGQFLNVNAFLGIEPSSSLHLILGATFDWIDLVAYTVGAIICYWVERE
ncbi:DUF2809 domain-containing protein [Aliivibrio sp. S3MY1]|uniref:DUF2809 domain-containing protein n=2 Tax=Aliivibrio TaxID=511678 RepID=A0A5Q4ZYZ3_9GAMM|nr:MULTISPECIES: DUF2809 domain-containing protein [Aliivibrio]MDD9195733.1 DUF2809 domain-containing protein [Aliivibrio sp. S3MY1]VVV07077.1 hypothetical protein AW0309160_04571 [Aliivibrio wodanis]